MSAFFTPAAEHTFAIALVICCTLLLAGWTASKVITWALADIAKRALDDLADDADLWGEPTRAEVEAGMERLLAAVDSPWPFDAPEFQDTPIYRDIRQEQAVLFAADVLADIDAITGEAS